jgi:type II secretory pathway pseudopilin PulG
MRHTKSTKLNQQAFTIVELLIATAVLSTILILVSFLIINVGNLYYKGINQARIQDNVRAITDEVSQHLQLSDVALPPLVTNGTTQSYCIGNTRYTFKLNAQIVTQTPHVLWRDDNPTPGGCPPINSLFLTNPSGFGSTNGVELIAPASSLTFFTISPTSPYTISIGEAYGDPALWAPPNGLNTLCQANKGQQFCATAHLTTTIVQRVTGGGS